jgi:hypothetical protein
MKVQTQVNKSPPGLCFSFVPGGKVEGHRISERVALHSFQTPYPIAAALARASMISSGCDCANASAIKTISLLL